MKKVILTLLLYNCLYTPGRLLAQSANLNNYISIAVNQPLIFNYNTADELIHEKIINNAIELKVRAAQSNADIYANVSLVGNGDPAQFTNQLSLRLRNKTSIGATGMLNNDVPLLVNSPLLIFSQPKMIDNSPYYSFYYDVVLHPFTSVARPGNYNFSIMFTMTQP